MKVAQEKKSFKKYKVSFVTVHCILCVCVCVSRDVAGETLCNIFCDNIFNAG